jgi:ParB family chromosome partitioning protein
MSVKKRALGRGLDSLIGPSEEATPLTAPVSATPAPDGGNGRSVRSIPLGRIRANANQPRSLFDEEHIRELADSIRENGILQPLLVRARGSEYEIVAGERRYRASVMLELPELPCLVVEADDRHAFVMAMIENLQREDLNPVEEAKAYRALIEQFDLSQEDVAQRVGKNRSTVANSLRLMNLPLDILDDVQSGRLTAGHARAILQIPEPPKQRKLRNLIISKSLSVRQAEEQSRLLSREKPDRPRRTSGGADAQVRNLQDELTSRLGLPVHIKPRSAQSGRVVIEYRSLDEFERISDLFGVEKG